ncbi:MAG: CorA family divalent cation transporter [Pirellulales bacterium]
MAIRSVSDHKTIQVDSGKIPPPAGVTAEFLDFGNRSHGPATLSNAESLVSDGRFVWIDIDEAVVDLAAVLPALPKVLAVALNQAAAHDRSHHPPATQAISTLLRGEAFLRMHLVGAQVEAAGLTSDMLGIMITPGFLLTYHRGRCNILEAVRQDYVHDFEQHATSPSFLVYEFWDKQTEQFLMIENRLDHEVESTRLALRQFADEAAFERLADVSGSLLALRQLVLPARRVLEELVSRKTTLISDATLEFLANKIDTLERVIADLISSREILESAMNFSLTVMTHRTNQTMNRLAVVSTIFLPLTFLCGVYGMNFNAMPEIEWVHGYAMFWVISAVITVSLTILLRRMRLL